MADGQARPARKIWLRAELPEAHKGPGVGWGNFLIVVGVAVLTIGPMVAVDAYGAGGAGIVVTVMLPLGGSLFGLGLVVTAVSLILREIRLMAFEAASRAGETEIR